MNDFLAQHSDKKLFLKFWTFIRPYKLSLFVSFVLVLMMVGAGLIQPMFIKTIVDDAIAGEKRGELWMLSSLFAGIVILEYGLRCLQTWVLAQAGENILRDLRRALYKHILSRSTCFFHHQPVGRLVVRLTTDVESLSEMFTSGFVSILADCVTVIGIVGMLIYLSLSMTLTSFLVLPLLVVVALYFRKKMRWAFRNIKHYVGHLNAYLAEHLNGMEVVQSFNQEKNTFVEYENINRKVMGFHFKNISYDSILFSVVEALGTLTIVLLIWFATDNLIQGIVTAGTLIAFIEYLERFFIPIRDISEKYAVMQSGFASLERIFGILENQEALIQPLIPIKLSAVKGQLEFRNVSFAYKLGEPILDKIHFKVNVGEKVAIVGPTGAGKSTLMKLATRLYDVDQGEVLLDGVDLRNYDLSQLRRYIGMISQDFFIFSGTVAENMSLADPSISMDSIREASRMVGIHSFIENLSHGYETKLAEKGANISVGQRQLISFARIFVFNPRVIILDEATSNVDTESELLIQKALAQVTKNRTSLIIAHRLSTIKNADRILVLHHGKILEEGPHDLLIQNQGLYQKLYSLQFQ
ncbi:MAG: ABC transporter ATP-binding protein [Deltaproteobacteria bacterium]|nr:ABC transporter ATP-binding protein [Deltaproteobacteria bacterium]